MNNTIGSYEDTQFADQLMGGWNGDPDHGPEANLEPARQAIEDASVEKLNGSGILQLAAQHGSLGFCQLIVQQGGNVDARVENGDTPLWVAVKGGHESVANFLVDSGADIHHENAGRTPAKKAVMEGMAPTVGHMLSAGLDLKQHDTLLHHARTGEVAELLINAGANVNAKDVHGNTPLHDAVYNAWHQEGEAHGMDEEVAARGPSDLVHALVKRGADLTALNDRGETPSDRAQKNGQHQTAAFLDAAGQAQSLAASIPKPRDPLDRAAEDLVDSALFDAARSGDLHALREALDAGAGVDEIDYEDTTDQEGERVPVPRTALQYAAREGHVAACALLLDRGAEVDMYALGETNALRESVHAGQLDTAACLLNHGANINAKDAYGDTPLHDAVLSAYGMANRDNKSSEEIAKQETTPMMHLLIERGADLTARNNRSETPSDRAQKNGQHQTAAFLDAANQAQSLTATIPKPRHPMDRPAEILGSLLSTPTPPRSTRRRL